MADPVVVHVGSQRPDFGDGVVDLGRIRAEPATPSAPTARHKHSPVEQTDCRHGAADPQHGTGRCPTVASGVVDLCRAQASHSLLAPGDQDSTVHFWTVKTGTDLMMSGYPTKVKELSWDGSSRYLATGGGPMPCVWDCTGKGPANTAPIQYEAHTDRVTALAFQQHMSVQTALKDEAQNALGAALRQVAAYVQSLGLQNMSQVLSSGYDVVNPNNTPALARCRPSPIRNRWWRSARPS